MKDSPGYRKYINTNLNQESRWATDEEMKEAGLRIDLTADVYPGAGLPLWSDSRIAYVDNNDNHTLIEGATGSKKTRNIVMPMINMVINAGESFIVSDPKGEIYSKTSGMAQKRGFNIIVFNLREIGLGDMWNPLFLPYKLYHEGKTDESIMMLNDFVASISDEQRKNTKDIFWIEAANSLAIANLLVMIENASAEEFNISNFTKLCSASNKTLLMELAELVDENSIAGMNYKGILLEEAEKTMDCICVSLFAMIRMFINQPNLLRMLSGSSFDVEKIGREKTAVYVIVPDEKTTNHALVSIFIKQAYEVLINEAQKEKDFMLPCRVNIILDEFCNIPRIPDMHTMISAARSRNIRFFLISQSLHQLRARYGLDSETIKGNCENRVFMTSKELCLLDEISQLCGNIRRADGHEAPLLSTTELQRFSKSSGEVLVLHGRQYPYVTYLPDIGEYEMFDGYESVPVKPFDLPEVKNIGINTLIERVRLSSGKDVDAEQIKKMLDDRYDDCIEFYDLNESSIDKVIDAYNHESRHDTNKLIFNSWKDLSEVFFNLVKDDTTDMCEIHLLSALLGAIYLYCSVRERNVVSLLELLNNIEVRPDEGYRDCIDRWFDELREKSKRRKEFTVPICNYDCYKSASYERRKLAIKNCKDAVIKYLKGNET